MKYALIIGNKKYNDPTLAPLKTPEADSRELAKVLRAKKIGSFDKVYLLLDPTETRSRRAISAFLSNKKPDDLVLLYFSGHGILDDQGSLFLALKNTEMQTLSATAIASSFISYEMDKCRSRRQILILDCCHSGAFARGTKGKQKAITGSTFEGNGSGRVVLTASDSTQVAFEGDQVIEQSSLSLFTHFLLEGLRTGEADLNNDGQVSLDEWYDYCHARITAVTPQQIPHKWSYRQQGDLIIARNPVVKKRKKSFLPDSIRSMLEQKHLEYRQHKLLIDPEELEIIRAEIEHPEVQFEEADKKLLLFSALAHGKGEQWLAICGAKSLEWLRQAWQDESCSQEVRRGAAALLGRNEDSPTYDRLLDYSQRQVDLTKRNAWLDLLTHYLNASEQLHQLPWRLRGTVSPRLAQLRIRDGLVLRGQARKAAAFLAPVCVIIMMFTVYLQARANPDPFLNYAGVTLVLCLLGVFVAYLFAEAITSLILITQRWMFAVRAIALAGTGSLIGVVLFFVLAGQGGLWFEGGIVGLAQLLNSKTRQIPRWYSVVTALSAGVLVFLLSLQVIDDARLVEYGSALSTGTFTAIYVYMTRRAE